MLFSLPVLSYIDVDVMAHQRTVLCGKYSNQNLGADSGKEALFSASDQEEI